MTKKRIVPNEAKSTLTLEATIRETVPAISKIRLQKAFTIAFAENTGDDPLSVVQAFTDCVFSGITPPPQVLIKIAEKFAKYLDSGLIDLDYAFELKSKQGSGHPIQQRTEKSKRGHLLHLMWQERKNAEKNGTKLSIRKAAEMVINKYCGPDYPFDALVKNYCDMEIDKVFDDTNEVLDEYFKSLDESDDVDISSMITDLEDLLKK